MTSECTDKIAHMVIARLRIIVILVLQLNWRDLVDSARNLKRI